MCQWKTREWRKWVGGVCRQARGVCWKEAKINPGEENKYRVGYAELCCQKGVTSGLRETVTPVLNVANEGGSLGTRDEKRDGKKQPEG